MADQFPATIQSALRQAREVLESSQSETPGLDAELLLAHLKHRDRTWLLAHLDDELGWQDHLTYQDLIRQRTSGVSVAYLTGIRGFRNLDLTVGPGALVPRPETELLVEQALTRLRANTTSNTQRVLDIGTGTGAIALAIASEMSAGSVFVVASEVSSAALTWATGNLNLIAPPNPVHFVLGNLLDWSSHGVDLVVANLPYLRPDQVFGEWSISQEPTLALIGGDSGSELILQLLDDCTRVLTPDGTLLLECDPGHIDELAEAASAMLSPCSVVPFPDLAGDMRFIDIRRESEADS